MAAEYPYFAIWKSSNGQYYFHLKAKNGEKIVQSELYTTKAAAQKGIDAVIRNAAEALTIDMTNE